MRRVTLNDQTLALAFEERVGRFGDHILLKERAGKAWRGYSWNEIGAAASRLRAGLVGAGIKPGDRVAILAENSPQWVIADQAVLGMGGVVVPLYTTIAAEETAHVLNDSGARLIAVKGAESLRKILALAPSIPKLERIVMLDSEAAPETGAAAPPVATLAAMSAASPMAAIDGRREDLATLIYTSGTTGPSKGAMLTHGNLIGNCEGSLNALELDQRDVVLSFLPIAHSFERTAGYYTVTMCGGTIAYAEGLSQIAQDLQSIRPTVFLVVPRLLEVVYNRVMRSVDEASGARRRLFHSALGIGKRAAAYRHRGATVPPHLALAMALFRRLVFGRIRAIFGDRMRYLISGGAPLPVEIFEFLSAAEVPIYEGYGLTEAGPVVSVNLPGRTRIGTVGRPLVNVEVKTAGDGELLVHGPNVMKGYFGREDETREALDGDGWLLTGDIARIDNDGYIAIVDRKKEIIVLSGGKNVSPANLETRLSNDPYIAQVCIVGDRRKHLAALIVPDFEQLAEQLRRDGIAAKPPADLINEKALKALFQRRIREFNRTLADFEAISAFTLIADPFSQDNGELTPTLKLRRRVVMAHYREQIEAMYRD
ncbi:MAG TPA: long-chain fatty acid--CoA ligase [Candidatus Binataceae bacterium]|nr:long-chain fatty acid--CoA ligase [Candidatus Binataceae bacterium]